MKLRFLFFFLSFLTLIAPSYSQFAPNVWGVLRSQFALNHETHRKEVQEQIRWFMAHPGYLKKLTQAKPYIYHIITEIKKKNLPGELALLPMIESAYDPFAYSGVGAAGLWQLMPRTGQDLGLKQDWWFDARRSIPSSTNAALNYLSYLNKYFAGDWILAIAAYDAGAGTISRAVKNSGQFLQKHVHFWSLIVPNETKTYVPRFLALAEMIRDPAQYGVQLPEIPYAPYFLEVNIGSQIDLNRAAKLAGISYRELIKLNPGYNHWTTAPNQPFKLLIPADKASDFIVNLARIPREKRVSLRKHRVQNHETIASIAQRYFTTTKLIRELNQLKTEQLYNGQFLLIPSTRNTTVVAQPAKPIPLADKPAQSYFYKVIHIVQPYEEFQQIANKYQVTVNQLQIWNNVETKVAPRVGTQLMIWKKLIEYGRYTARAGDSLKYIASQNQTTVSKLLQLNPQFRRKNLSPGETVIIG